MDHDEIKKRFKKLLDEELNNHAPQIYARKVARQALIKQLMAAGVRNPDAVYRVWKAETEVLNSA